MKIYCHLLGYYHQMMIYLYSIITTKLRQNNMKNLIKDEEIKKIKKQLPLAGAYKIISGMINGAYKPNTIKAMINQQRTMNPGVLQAAKQLVEINNNSNIPQKENAGYKREVVSMKIINRTK